MTRDRFFGSGWHGQLERIFPGAAAELAALAELLDGIGVHLAGKTTLQVVVLAGGRRFNAIGVNPDGDVMLPWSVAGPKRLSEHYAARLAIAIPGAERYETPCMWNVRMATRRRVNLRELLGAREAVTAALLELSQGLAAEW